MHLICASPPSEPKADFFNTIRTKRSFADAAIADAASACARGIEIAAPENIVPMDQRPTMH